MRKTLHPQINFRKTTLQIKPNKWPGLSPTVGQGADFKRKRGKLQIIDAISIFTESIVVKYSPLRNGRLQYAQELAKYIGVDIYGACGSLR